MEPLTSYRKSLNTLVIETQFLLMDPNGERYSVTRIKEKLNESALSYCLKTQLIKEEINIQLKEDIFEYDVKTRVQESVSLRYYAFPLRIGYDGDNEPAVMPGSLLAIDFKGYRRDLSMMPSLWYLDAVSPGKIQILGPPQKDGQTPPSERGNLQVQYVAMPTYMDTGASYPDTIPSFFHRFLPYGAASLILEDGDKDDLIMAIRYEGIFYSGVTEQVAEEYRGRTPYDDCRPM